MRYNLLKNICIIVLYIFVLSFKAPFAGSSSLFAQDKPLMQNYCATPTAVKTNDYSNIMMLLDHSGSMDEKAYDNSSLGFSINDPYYGYFKNDAKYCYSNVFNGLDSSTHTRPLYYYDCANPDTEVSDNATRFDKILGGQGEDLNVSMTKVDLMHWILTGGYPENVERCVQVNSCLDYTLNGAECPEMCLSVDTENAEGALGLIMPLIESALSATGVGAAVVPALELLLKLLGMICLPDPIFSCYELPDEDECLYQDDKTTICEWQSRDMILFADNSVGVNWEDASSFVENNCIDGLTYTDKDNTTGCLEGILQKIHKEWRVDEKPRIGGLLYSSSATEDNVTIPSFDYIDLIKKINSATVDNTTESAATSSAVDLAAEYFSSVKAYTFDTLTVPCTKNIIYYFSDGLWTNTDPVDNFHSIWGGGNADINDGIDGNQAVETYVFDMNVGSVSGEGTNSTKHAAIFGGYRDYNLDGLPCNYDSLSTQDSKGAVADSCSEWDGDLDSFPDNYYSTDNKTEYLRITKDIFRMPVDGSMEKVYTGTTPVIIQGNGDNGMWLQTFYYPKLKYESDNIKSLSFWIGDVHAYFLDSKNSVREDLNEYTKLKYDTDNIVAIENIPGSTDEDNTVMARIFGTTDDTGIPNNCADEGIKEIVDWDPDIETINPIWSSLFDWLFGEDAPARTIFYAKVNSSSNTEITDNFNSENILNIKDIWGIDDETAALDLIKYIRGEDRPFRLGSIVNSSPVIVNSTSARSYQYAFNDLSYYDFAESPTVINREPVIIVGANDGMVHAFKTGEIKDINSVEDPYLKAEVVSTDISEELWAFIPANALPYLRWYQGENDKCHIPKVDYRFTLTDARIGGDENNGWSTLLIGVMGFGGKEITIDGETYSSSIFVLDVTDPASPKFLWEESIPDKTLTLTSPAIRREGERDEEGEWKIVVGSGPKDPFVTEYPDDPKLYIYNLATGGDPEEVDAGVSNRAVGELMEIDADMDYQTDAVVFGTYDNSTGSLHVLDVQNGNISTIISDKAPFYAKPEVAADDTGYLWIYAGTGRLFNDQDLLDETQNYIYGIRSQNKNSADFTAGDLFDSTNIEVTGIVKVVECYCNGVKTGVAVPDDISGRYTCVKGDPVVTEVSESTSVETEIGPEYGLGNIGWVVNLDPPQSPSERVFSKPEAVGGLVNISTYTCTDGICYVKGTTKLRVLNYKTGTSASQPVFTVLEGTSGTGNEVEISSSITLGPVGESSPPPMGSSMTVVPHKGEGEIDRVSIFVGSTKIEIKTERKDIHSRLIFKKVR